MQILLVLPCCEETVSCKFDLQILMDLKWTVNLTVTITHMFYIVRCFCMSMVSTL